MGGANRGPQVEAYLKSIGLGGGNAWCAAFVYWCINQAAAKLGQDNPYVKTGWCPTIERSVLQGLAIGAQRTLDSATLILRALGDFITNLANPQISGPVGIVSAIGTVRSSAPPVFFVYFIALLSANLAVVNALPLPPLDGGRVAVSLIQAAFGQRISVSIERFVYLAGFVFLMSLLAYVTLFDTGILQRTP